MFNLDLRWIILPPGPLPPLDQLHKRATPCRSFVFNFLDVLWIQVGAATPSLIDTGGTAWACVSNVISLRADALATDAAFGIQVGIGQTLPTASDYKLATQIGHGSGAGQLMYAGMAFIQPYIVDTITYAALRRNFTNQSGNPITIQEIAWVHRAYASGAGRNFLAARDLIPGGSLVAAGATKQLIYTLATEV